MIRMLSLVFVLGCGSLPALTGDVPVQLEFHGSWNDDAKSHVKQYVEGLEPAGYFKPLGVAPHFHVEPTSKLLIIHLWGPGTTPDVPAEYRQAYGMHLDGETTNIHVMPTVTQNSDFGCYTVAHEMVESVVRDEIADACQMAGYALLNINGIPQRVPKYMVNQACVP